MEFSTRNVDLSVILVTGGNGELGRFIIELIVELLPNLKTIRILDKDPNGKEYYASKFENSGFNVEYFQDDMRNTAAIRKAVSGVQCVFHTAGVVDTSMFPDDNLMWAVNCRGTQDLMEACYENNVEYFIYTSSVTSIIDAAGSYSDATEDNCPKPSSWLWGAYGETKCLAERIVLDANKVVLPNGKVTKTVCLRPTVFYGENDRSNIPTILKMSGPGGKVFQIGSDANVTQQSYVGNVAWAHLCALQALCNHPGKTAGNTYFITDNTPMLNPFRLAEPFIKDRGGEVISIGIPVWIIYYWILVVTVVLRFCRKCSFDLSMFSGLNAVSMARISSLMRGFSFSRAKAEERLDYQPRYSYEESIERSRKYYSRV